MYPGQNNKPQPHTEMDCDSGKSIMNSYGSINCLSLSIHLPVHPSVCPSIHLSVHH